MGGRHRAAWDSFYSPEHVRTILRRTAACRVGRPGVTLSTILLFRLMPEYEGVHPLEGGIFRLKFRRDRRHGMKRANPFVFYPAYVWETFKKGRGYWRGYRQFKTSLNDALKAPDRWQYSDAAIAPPQRDEFQTMALYHETAGGEAALARKRRDDAIRAGASITAA